MLGARTQSAAHSSDSAVPAGKAQQLVVGLREQDVKAGQFWAMEVRNSPPLHCAVSVVESGRIC